jgi:hypothetical protein
MLDGLRRALIRKMSVKRSLWLITLIVILGFGSILPAPAIAGASPAFASAPAAAFSSPPVNVTLVAEPAPAISPKSRGDTPSVWLQVGGGLSRFITGIAWPGLLLVFILLYRQPLTRLIDRIKSLSWGDKGAQFADQVQALKDEAQVEPTPPEVSEAVASATASTARVDPRGAILSAWNDVEVALNEVVAARRLGAGYSKLRQRPLTAFRLVQQENVLDKNYQELFHQLRALRNEAAHAPEFTPPPDSVVQYAELAKQLADELRKNAQSAS